jgi:hypothetical protein
MAVYPEIGPVCCRTISVIDSGASGTPCFYAVNAKYLVRGTLRSCRLPDGFACLARSKLLKQSMCCLQLAGSVY